MEATPSATMTSHQRRSRIPISANGMIVGLITARPDGHHQRVPSATAAVHQITGLPNTNLAGEYGQARQSATPTHVHGPGRWHQMTAAMIAAGISVHSQGPRYRN